MRGVRGPSMNMLTIQMKGVKSMSLVNAVCSPMTKVVLLITAE